MNIKRFLLIWIVCLPITVLANPIDSLLERIDIGASKKIAVTIAPNPTDYFEISSNNGKILVQANNYVSAACGINWYLKYYVGVHLSWNNMQAKLPQHLPQLRQPIRLSTQLTQRYYLNYCTYSYSMAFWDWERWQKEIDWMALHGINMPLAIVGFDAVWHEVLLRLGYSEAEIAQFIAGPGFQAWWLMNNLEGWGGPNSTDWYTRRIALQQQIIKRMKQYGMTPVLPGYAGMVPNNAAQKLKIDVADPGLWCGYKRPAFLLPTDTAFHRIANLYYEVSNQLFGKAKYYSIDPFHEGGNINGIDLKVAGKQLLAAMKRANPNAVWVAQSWQDCPHEAMLEGISTGDIMILDLHSENVPQWGDPHFSSNRTNGYGKHQWLYCMLLNFGGNVGLHGKLQQVPNGLFNALNSPHANTLKGVGLTMEGIENNSMMVELLYELPWRSQPFDVHQWLTRYAYARYGKPDTLVAKAWKLLGNSIYSCPPSSNQQGTHESIFCARPSLKPYQVSSWSQMKDYYNPLDVIKAAEIMNQQAKKYRGNANFEYDLIDITRQAVAEIARLFYPSIRDAYEKRNQKALKQACNRFLKLIKLQDKLLATQPQFMLGSWIESAKQLGITPEEKELLEWNARVQITTWGNRNASEKGGLHDYAHKEWSGLLTDFYYKRWQLYFNSLQTALKTNTQPTPIDFYSIEESWTLQRNIYPTAPKESSIDVAQQVLKKAKTLGKIK